jgi:hypothetical protein
MLPFVRLVACAESSKRPLACARGSVDSFRYGAATVREPVLTQAVREFVMLY